MPSFLEHLKQRKVFQWSLAYLTGAWAALEFLDVVAEPWGFSGTVVRGIQVLLGLGFVATVIVAWYHGEVGYQGVRGSEIFLLTVLLAVGAVALSFVDSPADFVPQGTPSRIPLGPNAQVAGSAVDGETDPGPATRVSLGVMVPRGEAGPEETSDRARLVQHLLASELSGRRSLAVADPFSLTGQLSSMGTEGEAEVLSTLREWGLEYAVRVTDRDAAEVAWLLLEVSTGEVLLAGDIRVESDEELSEAVREAALRILEGLERERGGLTLPLDARPWLSGEDRDIDAVRAFLQGMGYSYRLVPGGREHFERAVALDPDFIAPRVWLVSGAVARGDTVEAQARVDELRDLLPDATPFEQAMIGWAEAVAYDDLEAKVAHLRVALTHSPGNNVLLHSLGMTLLEMGLAEQALVTIREALASRWSFQPLHILLAEAAIAAGEVDGLRERLEELSEPVGSRPEIDGILEALALYEGDLQATTRYGTRFRARLAERPGSMEAAEMAPFYRQLAGHARARDSSEAEIRLLRKAVDLDPGSPIYRLELARALAETGSRREAEEEYRAVGSLDGAPAILLVAGEVEALLGRTPEARRHLERYLELAPDGPEADRARERLRSLSPSSPSAPSR